MFKGAKQLYSKHHAAEGWDLEFGSNTIGLRVQILLILPRLPTCPDVPLEVSFCPVPLKKRLPCPSMLPIVIYRDLTVRVMWQCVRLVIGWEGTPAHQLSCPITPPSPLHTTPNFFSIQACPVRFLFVFPIPLNKYSKSCKTGFILELAMRCGLCNFMQYALMLAHIFSQSA